MSIMVVDRLELTIKYPGRLEEILLAGGYIISENNGKDKFNHQLPLLREKANTVEKLEFQIFDFSHGLQIRDQAAVESMRTIGCRPATLAEALILGIKYFEIKKNFSGIVIGDVWTDTFGFRTGQQIIIGKEKHLNLYGLDATDNKWAIYPVVAVSKGNR